MSWIKDYWNFSKSPFYSLIFAFPLIIIYEFMIFSLNHSDIMGIRNGADVLFRQFFALFGIYGFYLVGFFVLLALFLSYYFHIRNKKNSEFHYRYFILMLFESLFYGMLLLILLNQFSVYLMAPETGVSAKQMVALAMGAGVYEEFIFRVIMITALVFLLRDILRFNEITAKIIAMIAASILFSVFHYIGPFGDEFQWFSFIVRFVAGIFLSVLYLLRGYGITAYAHTIYDLIVISL